ncbi:hypothetical protein N2601_32250 (plasmid) [Rhizobium sp. CB3060]|uniref:hypothetical protein n=1 Tax=Rhizobium sp. CB3060 TaxID=3138255 RepID=UPI0021A64F2D|nr:hypothetical protein [Rhizobium tropici]UWU26002.1 hypothetical protein N2601_32250 [Rhizobium tropici]
MHWKIIALAFGWRLARDNDEEDLFVVYHPGRREHFSGEGAWRQAALRSIRAPRTDRDKGPRP